MKTFNKFLHEENPELYQYLINVNLRQEVSNMAEIYALRFAMEELEKNRIAIKNILSNGSTEKNTTRTESSEKSV